MDETIANKLIDWKKGNAILLLYLVIASIIYLLEADKYTSKDIDVKAEERK